MMSIALTMSREERLAVASYLGTPNALSGPPAAAFCSDRTVRLDARPRTTWNGWSPGIGNARFQTADAAGLRGDQVGQLKLKWAFGFDGDVSAFSQPTMLDGHLFVGSAAGVVHAMRAIAAVSSGRSRRTDRCAPRSLRCRSMANMSSCLAT